MKLGIPCSLSLFIDWGSFEVNSAIAGQLGTIPLATQAILCLTAAIWYQIPAGLATAAATYVGNALGAAEPGHARQYSRVTFVLDSIYGLFNGGIGMIYAHYWGSVWSDDAGVVELVAYVMPMLWYYGFFDSLKCQGNGILRGIGRPSQTVWVNFISCLMVGYPLAFLLVFGFQFGLRGLWFAMSTSWLVASSSFIVIIYRTDWQAEVEKAAERNRIALGLDDKTDDLVKEGEKEVFELDMKDLETKNGKEGDADSDSEAKPPAQEV